MSKFNIACIQLKVGESKEKNIARAIELIKEAVNKKSHVVVLPEMFNCPYKTDNFPEYAELEGGNTWSILSNTAKKLNIYLVGGSIPEKDIEGNIYNTSYIFNKNGEQIGKHRKIHLFDINIENGQRFKESDTLASGNEITIFNTEFCKIGMSICYDIRFPELHRIMTLKGAEVIVIPGAFNMTTGPAHWELLFRTRALDNQVYTVGCAPARNMSAEYISYGNSISVSPWGEVIGRLDEKEGILISEIDLGLVSIIRQQLPLLQHRRRDVY